MSRIGKKPIAIPKGVKVEQKGQSLKVTGPVGSLELECYRELQVKIDSAAGVMEIVNPKLEDRTCREMHGTTRALLSNMMTGVTKGFEKKFEIYGTGYSVKEQGGKVILQVGYCNPVEVPVPKGVKITIEVAATRGNEVPAKFGVSGADRCVVGQMAAAIRKVRPPEPYKGKGIRYADERIERKVGKAFASGGGA
jgi:large subunit ribosomal protein L6